MTRPLLTARETAVLLGLHPDTVLDWAREEKIPSVKLPSGAVRFEPDRIDDWIAEKTRGMSAAANRGDSHDGRRAGREATEVRCEVTATTPPPT